MNIEFNLWANTVINLICEKQRHPFANYRKNRWKQNGKVFKSMYREGMTPQQAAGLWALNHQK